MKQEEFRRELASVTPDVPERFSRRVNAFLAEKVDQEVCMNENHKMMFRVGRRTLAVALAALLLLGTAAVAAGHWGIFDALSFMLGNQPVSEDAAMEKIVHQETVNNVEITIHEAIYDGRTLFLQYSHRPLDATESAASVEDCNVGWWIDHFWINGQCMDMAANSGSVETGTAVPGQILKTEYWRLDNLDVALSGKVEIALPIGQRQPLEDYSRRNHPEKYDEDGNLLKPDKGLVTFSFDVGDVLSHVTTLHPESITVTPEVTVRVSEAAFTPLMSYITLETEVNEQAMADFIAENGDGWYNEEGELMWPYGGMDVFGSYISGLHLTDGNGQKLFPEHHGCSGYGNERTEYLYPALETLPDALYLAPFEEGQADMSRAIQIK